MIFTVLCRSTEDIGFVDYLLLIEAQFRLKIFHIIKKETFAKHKINVAQKFILIIVNVN